MGMKDMTHYVKWKLEGLIKQCPFCPNEILPNIDESKPRYLKRSHCGSKKCRKAFVEAHKKELKAKYYSKGITIYD